MNERWSWVLRYVAVIALALVLAAVLGDMALFKVSKLGKTGISAARLVQFLGYGGALVIFWLMAQRASEMIAPIDGRTRLLKCTLLPVATLIAIAAGHVVVKPFVLPLLKKAWYPYFNWVFITLIVLAACWLVASLLRGSSSVLGARRP
jgi:hypothetical protein